MRTQGGNVPKALLDAGHSNGALSRILPVRSSRSEVPLLTSTTETQNSPSLLWESSSNLPSGLPFSASRVGGENGPWVRRAFGHAASPRRCTQAPGLPASRARPSPAAPPDCALVCFGLRPKRSRRSIRLPRPVEPFACSGRANLPSKHTHMSVEAYPPDGPQISPRQGSQNFSARAAPVARGGPVGEDAHVSGAARGKLLRPASRRLRRP